MSKALIVLVTIPQSKARVFAKKIVKKRLSACVNIIKGVESVFWWQGKIDTAKEALLLIKTKQTNFTALKKFIESIHPYLVCEVIAVKVDKINQKYLSWLLKESSG